MRVFVLFVVAAGLALGGYFAWVEYQARKDWPHWEAFHDHFVQADGRVVDRTAQDRSTSEGQVYALFFAVVANQPERFAKLLSWTANNLADGDLRKNLPAWLWGRKPDGGWGILDQNPASDANVWLAYALLEAGRLWQVAQYDDLGRAVLANVVADEVVDLPGVGKMLIPAREGFTPEPGFWRLNPSYIPPYQFERLAQLDPSGPWREILRNSAVMLAELTPHGLAPDWAAFKQGHGFVADEQTEAIGSYDAIRVYLWAGMGCRLDGEPDDTLDLRDWLLPIGGMAEQLYGNQAPPERIDTQTGVPRREHEPPGFSAAMLPYLAARSDAKLLKQQKNRLNNTLQGGLYGETPAYYDQVLALFGKGRISGRFRFGSKGELLPRWGHSWFAPSGDK